jgi:hypothetical protein
MAATGAITGGVASSGGNHCSTGVFPERENDESKK